ncbi:MAG TPA: MarR family transcriptional regulator [Steroidobacteraceae bacterium]|nr:MarR family transcriptional regulator [Steroidobacteraceae bacterium]
MSRRAAKAVTSPSAPGRESLELWILQSFRTVVGSARNYDAEVRARTGISGSQLWALWEISRAGGMRVNALAERLALHQTTASNMANVLSERRLIRRARDGADQRVVRLHATADGMRLLLRAPRPYAGLLVDALQKLEPAELSRLSRSLAALIGAMRRPAAASAGETFLAD